jgi:hypothetical protein
MCVMCRDFHDGGLLCEVGWVDCEAEGLDACLEEKVVSGIGIMRSGEREKLKVQ